MQKTVIPPIIIIITDWHQYCITRSNVLYATKNAFISATKWASIGTLHDLNQTYTGKMCTVDTHTQMHNYC